MPTTVTWTLQPGKKVKRKQLQEQFGGRTQGGIGPSKRTPNVFLFTDPASGEQHGYFDGWQPDGCFHYTGEGQRGDQRMTSGNRSILEHADEGRALRLFQGARGEVTYIDEFVLDPEQPWYETDAPETGGGPIRKVIVFRLRPITIEPQPPQSQLASVLAGPAVVEVDVEEQRTEKTFIDPDRTPYEAERREAALVTAFARHLSDRGHRICRQRIVPPGEHKPLYTDLYDATDDLLVEAKGTVSREAVRMAIGQLADYGRFVPARQRGILLPSKPRPDLLALAAAEDVIVIWPAGTEFLQAAGQS